MFLCLSLVMCNYCLLLLLSGCVILVVGRLLFLSVVVFSVHGNSLLAVIILAVVILLAFKGVI